MRQVLMENALEAWGSAIKFCDYIKDGKCTLQYQKKFVSSLHNAVELIMKQMMLNNNDYRVANIRKVTNEEDARLLLDYYQASDLNRFFGHLSEEQLSKFRTISFDELISLHTKFLESSSLKDKSLKNELKLLKNLRNSETHFLIHQGSFLSEKDFCILHNFMISFYQLMLTWSPINEEDYELFLLPYWGIPHWVEPDYSFERELLQSFSYESAVRNSKLTKEIIELFDVNFLYGCPSFDSYSITRDFLEETPSLAYQFDEVWATINMMQHFKMIEVDEMLDPEGQLRFCMRVSE